MTAEEKVKRFREIVTEMADLYESKNRNYGDSFGKLYKDLGPVAGLVPLHNKLDRATNLVKGDENKFESLEDTFKDLACYAIMNLIAMEEAKKGQTLTLSSIGDTPQVIVGKKEDESILEYIRRTAKSMTASQVYYKSSSSCKDCAKQLVVNGCDGCAEAPVITCKLK